MTIESVVAPSRRVVHAVEERAVRHAGRGDEDVLARDEIVRVQDGRRVEPGVEQRLALVVVARPEPSLDAAADALERRGRDDAFRRAADAVEHVDARARLRRGDRRRDVAVADQADARAGLAQLRDQLVVAVALEHDDVDLARRLAERLGDRR